MVTQKKEEKKGNMKEEKKLEKKLKESKRNEKAKLFDSGNLDSYRLHGLSLKNVHLTATSIYL